MTMPIPPGQPDPTDPGQYWSPGGTDDEGNERPPVWIPDPKMGLSVLALVVAAFAATVVAAATTTAQPSLRHIAASAAVTAPATSSAVERPPLAAALAAHPVTVTPRAGDGWISFTGWACGSSRTWTYQRALNGGAAGLYLGRWYRIDCGAMAAPAPAAPSSTWVNPLPGTCRPSYGGGQFGAPRNGYRHQGIDLGGIEGYRIGTPVRAAHAGAVVVRGYSGNAGNQLQIRQGGVLVKYNHLNGFNVGIGQWVNAGDVIGYMGATGNATGGHLHVEVYIDGALRNPTTLLPVGC